MKIGAVLLLFLSINLFGYGQCFTIESVLADACGDPEGENEMVVLRVNQTMDINNLVFNWPNNSFLGWCPSPSNTAQLNQTIVSSCGFLIEPVNGIVPAGESLLVVSSTNMLIAANSFQGLADTLYIIFQCAGNTDGHFSNLANSPRTLGVSYSGTCIGAQTVSYLPTDLPGGDGGAIYYDTLGNATYYNTGCNAPVPGLNPFWDFPPTICSDYGIVDLNDFLSGNATLGGTWSGDVENGNFFNPSGKLGAYSITYTVEDTSSCLGIADSTIQFVVEDVSFGADTIVACDSIRQFGFWIYNDTLIEISVANPNTFRCDSIVRRFYQINQLQVEVNPAQVNISSGSSFNFQLSPSTLPYSFGNIQGDSCLFPCSSNEITPSEEGTYYIQVIDTVSGCEQLVSIEVSLRYNSSLNVPTAFTPNGDGVNDFYQLYGKDLDFLKFQIFGRWGELIFEGTSLNERWDGTFKAKVLASQLFLIQIDATGKDGRKFEITEKIKLIR